MENLKNEIWINPDFIAKGYEFRKTTFKKHNLTDVMENLIRTRGKRIDALSFKDPLLRTRKGSLSANKRDTLKDLEKDCKLLEERIEIEEEKLNRDKLGY